MMMRKLAVAVVLAALPALASCIFQNDPLAPNQPPTILSYEPDVTFFTLTAPDSCSFSIDATDPDGDELRYFWFLGDSLLGSTKRVIYYAVQPGDYDIRAEARDASRRASRAWHITVYSKNNVPPVITSYFPDQKNVACAVGDTLEFHFKAKDENPAALQYKYLLNGSLLHSGSPALVNRFMERGDFLLDGVVSDGQYGDTVRWYVSVTGFPDTIAPAAITDLAGGPGDLDGTIWLEWTAPGDDGSVGRCASYIVRTSTYPIVTDEDWRQAEGKPGEPFPSVAGTRERMVIRNLVSSGFVYVTMRAVDDFFNISPLGNCIKVAVRGIDIGGRAVNAATNQGLAGIIVSAGIRVDTTDADGVYLLANVPSYATAITARDENSSGQPGNYYDIAMPIPAIQQLIPMDFTMIPVFDLVNIVPPDPYEGRFILFFKGMTKTAGDYGFPTIYRGWNHWPITVYNPPYTYGGIDMQAAARGAMVDWESSTGLDLFAETDTKEGADTWIIYDTVTVARHNVKTPELNADGTPKRREIWIHPGNTEVPITIYSHLVFAHELGHVIGLDHSRNVGHMMVGLTMPQVHHPTIDEINLVRCVFHMPNIFDGKHIKED